MFVNQMWDYCDNVPPLWKTLNDLLKRSRLRPGAIPCHAKTLISPA
jgi:hypothetical protein